MILYPYSITVSIFFKLNPSDGRPLYLQLMQQIRHAAEIGALKDGEQLPGIRTLAEQLLVSPNTVAKAYNELEHEGLLELRQGTGAFLCVKRRTRSRADRISLAKERVNDAIHEMLESGLQEDEMRRIFEAALLHSALLVDRQ